jgi:Zn-finger nucleic acid-binding protein
MKMLCPHCGVKGAADDSYRGKMVKCPKCETVFEVFPEEKTSIFEGTQASATLPPVESETLDINECQGAKTLKMLCPHCGVRGSADDSYRGKMVKCPKCETIFEVSPEGESLPERTQTPPVLSPFEPKEQDITESPDGMIFGADDQYEHVSASLETEDIDEAVSEIPALEAELQQEPVEALQWSDIADDLDLSSLETDQTDETTADTPLEEPEVSYSVEQEKTLYDASVPRPDVASTLRARGFQGNDPNLTDSLSPRSDFSILGVIKDAWRETKGAKASILAGTIVMCLVMFLIGAAGTFLGFDPATMAGVVISIVVQILLTLLSVIFTAGLLYMGVRKVSGDEISWKMVFKGFSFTGQIVVATVLQTILIGIGLLLLVLPGIYLVIGYGLTLPLILDREMSAWEAMETSRKAIHKVWWKVAGAFFLMSFIYAVSTIPLGIGLIWTVPMFAVLIGVVYRCLLGVEKNRQ